MRELNRIKQVLDERGISQAWLAKKLGKSYSIVNAYACNRVQPPLETLFEIADLLEIEAEKLLTKKNEK